jgi:diguanylate cyclase (GGDEF)-like protein/PAS domain S-box-containing protein
MSDGERYKMVLDDLYDGVYMTDTRRKVTYWNHGAERITGYTAGEVLGTHCWDNLLQHVDEWGNSLCHSECALSRALSKGEPYEMEAFLHHKHGHRVPVRIRVRPMRDASGVVTGAVEVFTDNFTAQRSKERIAELERMAFLDSLTGIANRRFGEVNLNIGLNELQRYGWPFGVILMDVDLLKEINDHHGHLSGDRALQAVATTLAGSSRPFDVISRWGGDEFLAIVKHVTEVQLDHIAGKYESLVASSWPNGDYGPIRVTISTGATLVAPNDSIQTILARADEILYGKKAGRGAGRSHPESRADAL